MSVCPSYFKCRVAYRLIRIARFAFLFGDGAILCRAARVASVEAPSYARARGVSIVIRLEEELHGRATSSSSSGSVDEEPKGLIESGQLFSTHSS